MNPERRPAAVWPSASILSPSRPAGRSLPSLFLAGLLSVSAVVTVDAECAGADPVRAVRDTARGPDGPRWSAVPYLFYSPETSLAVGGLGMILLRLDPEDPGRVSTLGLSGVYTFKGQSLVSSRQDFHLAGGWQLLVEMNGRLSWPDRVYPVGNESGESAWEEWTGRGVDLSVRPLKRIGRSPWFAGLQAGLRTTRILERETGGLIDSGGVPGAEDHRIAGAGAVVIADTRDDTVWPTAGLFTTFALSHHTGIGGTDLSFTRLETDLRAYLGTRGAHVLALRGFLSTASGEVPFTMLPALGGATALRGIYEHRFKDRTALVLLGEYRIPSPGRLGAVFFVGAGQVAHSAKGLAADRFHLAGGAGLRFQLIEGEGLNVGLDYAAGAGERGLYVILGEAF